jgi:hypothetical protein
VTAADPLATLRPDATPEEAQQWSEGRYRRATAPATLPRVPMRRVMTASGTVLAAEVAVMLATGRSLQEALLPGYGILMVTFGLVFCLGAVTVAGFAAGTAAAALLVLDVGSLLPLLAGAAVLALVCGIAPGWSRVEAWQAGRVRALTSEEEAAAAQRPVSGSGPRRWTPGVRLRTYWRTDRVLAAFLVLAFPPSVTAFALWFLDWTAGR